VTTCLPQLQEGPTKQSGMGKWWSYTLVGVFVGILYGGSKEASASVVSFHSLFHCKHYFMYYKSIPYVRYLARCCLGEIYI
jgi:hypothetical protein